jgi:glycerophosphoryl diester phosphodiesterase
VSPRLTDGLGWLTARPIAHRGLHDKTTGIVENTLSAARAAIAGGYAIEVDVQPDADLEPVVFHDETLERLTEGRPRPSSRGSRSREAATGSRPCASCSTSSTGRCRSSSRSRRTGPA